MILRGFSDDFQMFFRGFLVVFQIIFRWFSDNFQIVTRWFSHDFRIIFFSRCVGFTQLFSLPYHETKSFYWRWKRKLRMIFPFYELNLYTSLVSFFCLRWFHILPSYTVYRTMESLLKKRRCFLFFTMSSYNMMFFIISIPVMRTMQLHVISEGTFKV